MSYPPPQQRFGCYVGSIDRAVKLEVLKKLFSQCGVIVDCSLNGRDEDPYRYGFIDFSTEDARQRALKLDGFVLYDRKLKVSFSKGNVNKSMDVRRNMNNPLESMVPGNPGMPGAGMPPGGVPPAQLEQLLQAYQQGQAGLSSNANPTSAAQQPFMMPPQQNTPPPMPQMGYPPMGNPVPMNPMNPMPWGMPPMGMPMGYPQMYPQHHGRAPFTRGPANPPPSEETLKMREMQRTDFYKVVRKDAEKYAKKMAEKSSKEEKKEKDGSSDEDTSEEERDHKRTKKEGSEERSAGHSD